MGKDLTGEDWLAHEEDEAFVRDMAKHGVT